MDYEYYYDNAKSRYYDACSNISSCENQINDLMNNKNKRINEINELNSTICRYTETLEEIDVILKSEEELNTGSNKIKTAVEEASANFTSMIQSSDVSAKNLDEVYKNDNDSKLMTIFEQIKLKKNNVISKIEELENQKRSAENSFSDSESQINSLNQDISYWCSCRTNASIDMEYYKKKMEEEQ